MGEAVFIIALLWLGIGCWFVWESGARGWLIDVLLVLFWPFLLIYELWKGEDDA